MQHGKIIIQEAQRVIQYAESYITLHWQMMNVFNTILKRFLRFFCLSSTLLHLYELWVRFPSLAWSVCTEQVPEKLTCIVCLCAKELSSAEQNTVAAQCAYNWYCSSLTGLFSLSSQLNFAQVSAAVDGPTRRALSCPPIILYLKLDGQCDELETIAGRTKLTTPAMVDVLCKIFQSPDIGIKFKSEVWVFLEISEFPLKRNFTACMLLLVHSY